MESDSLVDIGIADIAINHLLVNGIKDSNVIDIMIKTSRHYFLPKSYQSLASSDGVIFFSKDRFIIEITTLACMLELINKPINNALVIGAGLGYGSAVFSNVSNRVLAIEEDANLMELAQNNINKIGVKNVLFEQSDLVKINSKEKFDLIIVEGGFKDLANEWLDLLNNNGIFIGVRRENNISKIIKVVNINGTMIETEHQQAATPYLPKLTGKDSFVF